MELKDILAVIAAVGELSERLPVILGAVKGQLKSSDEIALKAALDELQAKNKTSYMRVSALLRDLAAKE